MDDGGLEEGANGTGTGTGPPSQDVRKGIYRRLRDVGNEEALSDPFFEQLLDEHYERLPASYSMDLQADKAEDVLLHRRILAECADPDKRPVFHARFLRLQEEKPSGSDAHAATENGHAGGALDSGLRRDTPEILLIHEIIFSSIDKPKLLCELSTVLSELDLNIREAHVFSTTDGLCLGVFIVDSWETEETDGLLQQLKETARLYHPLMF